MSSKLKKQIQGELNFNSIQRERKFIISSIDQEDIFDISLVFYGQYGKEPLLSSQIFMTIEDLRLYLNGINYTQALKNELKDLLADRNIAEIRKQYKKGAEQFLSFLSLFNSENVSIENERTKLQSILSMPVKDLLNKLGDRTFGYFGNLHIINYLYSYIDLDPISINSLIKRKYPAETAKIKSVKDLVPITLTLSHGPAPSHEAFTVNPQPRGQLSYLIDLIYDNPLYELMQVIKNQTRDIQVNLETQRINYFDKIVNGVQTLEQDTELKLSELRKSVSDLSTSIEAILSKT